jgi:hypothetical protein
LQLRAFYARLLDVPHSFFDNSRPAFFGELHAVFTHALPPFFRLK